MSIKIAFVWMWLHKKTKSADFFLDLLYSAYDKKNIHTFYDDSFTWWGKDTWYLKNKDDYDIFIFRQILPSPKKLYILKGKKIIYIPMYDNFHPYTRFLYYLKVFNVRFISFSSLIHNFAKKKLWVDSLHVQYYLPLLPYKINYENKNIFWRYRGNITRHEVKTVIGKQKIDKLTIRSVPDPLYKKLHISQDDMIHYNIHIVDTFSETHQEHYALMAQHNIFIAPRRKEGIWMSFLEALNIWMCVIWYNAATMNEYITHQVDWLLTNFKEELNLDEYNTIWIAAQNRYVTNIKQREENKENIVIFLNKNVIIKKPCIMSIIIFSSLYYIWSIFARLIWRTKIIIK